MQILLMLYIFMAASRDLVHFHQHAYVHAYECRGGKH